MKFATIVTLGIVFLASLASVQAAAPAAGSQVVLAFSGGSHYTSDTTGICMFYPVLLGDLDLASLFAGPLFGAPTVDKEHAYFIWVSDFSIQALPPNKDFKDFNFLGLIPNRDGHHLLHQPARSSRLARLDEPEYLGGTRGPVHPQGGALLQRRPGKHRPVDHDRGAGIQQCFRFEWQAVRF